MVDKNEQNIGRIADSLKDVNRNLSTLNRQMESLVKVLTHMSVTVDIKKEIEEGEN